MSRIVVIVPARGGSKRVPGKNIRPLAGRPLLSWTLGPCRTALPDATIVVSTEDDAIAAQARADGARVVERPAELAGDTASTESALLHVLDTLTAEGTTFDWVLCLPPSSPFRRAATIADFVALADAADGPDAYFSATESRGDFWRRSADGEWNRLFPDAPRRQQEREPLFEENSAYYLTRVDALRRTGFILGATRRGVPINPTEAFDINTPADFQLAQAMVAAGLPPDRGQT